MKNWVTRTVIFKLRTAWILLNHCRTPWIRGTVTKVFTRPKTLELFGLGSNWGVDVFIRPWSGPAALVFSVGILFDCVPRIGRRTWGGVGGSFQYTGPVIWNSVPLSARHSSSLSSFKSKLKPTSFSSAYWCHFLLIVPTITSNACIYCVCVLEWERERESVCVCVCVCARAHTCVCMCMMKWVHPYVFVSTLGSYKMRRHGIIYYYHYSL